MTQPIDSNTVSALLAFITERRDNQKPNSDEWIKWEAVRIIVESSINESKT